MKLCRPDFHAIIGKFWLTKWWLYFNCCGWWWNEIHPSRNIFNTACICWVPLCLQSKLISNSRVQHGIAIRLWRLIWIESSWRDNLREEFHGMWLPQILRIHKRFSFCRIIRYIGNNFPHNIRIRLIFFCDFRLLDHYLLLQGSNFLRFREFCLVHINLWVFLAFFRWWWPREINFIFLNKR
jgi:hypothetical protein